MGRAQLRMIDEERKKRTILKMMERDYLYLDDQVVPGPAHGGRGAQGQDEAGLHLLQHGGPAPGGDETAAALPVRALCPALGPGRDYPGLQAHHRPHHQRDRELLPGRLPFQRCGDPGRRRSSLCGGGGREGLRLPDLFPDAGERRCLSPGRFRGQLHPVLERWRNSCSW